MANSEEVTCTIGMASEQSCLEEAVVIGVDDTGKVHVYTASANRDKVIVLLERAKLRLLAELPG